MNLYRWLPSALLDRPFCKGGKKSFNHVQLGELGEKMAIAYLRRNGLKVLYRNYRAPKGGEVDIVARDGAVLCFIEVKTRKKRKGSRPLDAVTKEKEQLIARGADAWLALLPQNDFVWRFDVVEVILEQGTLPELVHLKEVF